MYEDMDLKEDNIQYIGEHDHDECIPECDATFESVTEPLIQSIAVAPAVIPAGPVVVKLPVVIAESRIILPIVSTIKLEKTAFEIKRIRKNVFITQCHLLPNSADGTPNTGIVYIEGFVRKNIEYATKECSSDGVISGKILHTTGDVEFSTTTRVTFINAPIFTINPTVEMLELFNDDMRSCDICAEPIIGKEVCEQDFFHTENFNEKVFCELVTANIIEADIHRKPKLVGCKNPTEQTFHKITEKMVLDLTLKLLQNQQVRITAL